MSNKYVNALAIAVLAVSAGAAAHAQTYLKTINLPVAGTSAEQVAVDPIGNKIFAAVSTFGSENYDYLVEIDGKTDTVEKSVKIPAIAYAIAVYPGFVYVAGTDSNNNSKVATFRESDLKEVESVTISTSPINFGIQGIAYNPKNNDLYVTNPDTEEIVVIHCGRVKTRISTAPNAALGITVNPALNTIYAAELGGNVAVIDGASNTIVANNLIGTALEGIAVNTNTGDVISPNATTALNSDTAIVNAAGSLLTNVVTGNTPIGVTVDPNTNLAFVANTQDGTISRIVDDGASSTQASPATFPSPQPAAPISALFLAVNPKTQKVYASSADSSATIIVFSEN